MQDFRTYEFVLGAEDGGYGVSFATEGYGRATNSVDKLVTSCDEFKVSNMVQPSGFNWSVWLS